MIVFQRPQSCDEVKVVHDAGQRYIDQGASVRGDHSEAVIVAPATPRGLECPPRCTRYSALGALSVPSKYRACTP